MMKKRLFPILLVAVAVACSKNDDLAPAGQPGDLVLSIDAGTSVAGEDAADATRAGYDGAKSTWNAGDVIGVSFDTTNKNLQFSQEAGSLSADGTSVRYSGTLVNPISGNVTCTAYYPYSSSATVSGQSITTTFPATQTYNAAGGYKGLPLFATYTGDSKAVKLPFKNLFSVIKLSLAKGSALTGTVKLQSIVFQGNNGETVAGAMTVNMSGSTPVVSYTGTGKTIKLDCGDGVTLTTTPQIFYIAVPAIHYTKGYSFSFITDKGQVTKSAKNSGVQYAVNKVYAAPALTIDNLTITTAIPDEALRDALKNLGLISVLDDDLGKVSITTAGLQAASLDISGKEIADLTGLSNFPALVSLTAGNNKLTSVDLSKLTLLTNLDLSNNQLSTLNLSANTKLLTLNVSSNKLTALDLSKDLLLTSLNVSGNKLATLNLAANTALLTLDVSTNLLTALDLSKNVLLTSVKCSGNALVTLNISGLNALGALYLNTSNNIASLKLTVPTNATVQNLIAEGLTGSLWTSFECLSNTTIKTISLKNNVKLLSVTATGNTALTSLDVSGNTLQTTLRVYGSTLTTLNFSGLKALTGLYLNSGGSNCISLLTLTIPSSATIKNIIADGALLVGTWTRFACASNATIQTISLKNNVGLLGVTLTNNTALTSLVITGSGLGLVGVSQSGNATGFAVTN